MRTVQPARSGLAVGLLCAALGVGACDGQVTTPEGGDSVDVTPEVLSAMERDLGLTADEVHERLRVEAEAARLAPALRDDLGPDFGGAWMDATASALVVGITDPALADAVREAGAVPAVVARSADELAAVVDVLDADADAAPDAVHSWYADVTTNQVVVRAADPADPAVEAFVAYLGDAVRVEVSAERPRPLYDVRGGDEIIIGGTILCSMGFAVHGGYVTAGHCGGAGAVTYGSNWVESGRIAGSTFPGNDWAWVQTNGSWNTLPRVSDHGGGTVPVAGSAVAPVGASICRSGRTTGWRCGVVQAHDVTINYAAGPVYHATRTNACAEGGDSGGAFISGNQAQGVTSGGSGNCSSGGVTFFQPVNPILSRYGLALKTVGGGGQEIVSSFNGKCIDVPSSNFADGVKLQMWDCNGTAAQRWRFTGGTVRAGGLCMDVAWGATHDGAEIQIANCSGHPAQQFTLTPAGDLVSVLANKCVDIAGWNSDRGARLIIWSCHGGANQKWWLR